MKQMQKAAVIVGLTTSLIAVTPAFAQFYVGGGLGYSRVQIEDSALPITGATATSLSKDEDDIGWKLFGGYAFNRYVAVEAGYVDLGKASATRTMTAPAAGSVTGKITNTGLFADVVGKLPVGGDFSLFAKVGAVYAETKTNFATAGAVRFAAGTNLSPKERETNWKFGLGAQYDLTKSIALRGEWERYNSLGKSNTTGEGDVDLFSLSVMFKF